MKPRDFAPWAEKIIEQSPAVARVEHGPVGEGDEARPDGGTKITFGNGAQLYIGWVGTAPPTKGGATDESDPAMTGPAPTPITVPDLSASGRLRTENIEQHLAALLANGGHDQILDVTGYTADPKLGSETQPYGLRVRFHDESAVYGLFIHTLSSGQRPGKPYDQRKEV